MLILLTLTFVSFQVPIVSSSEELVPIQIIRETSRFNGLTGSPVSPKVLIPSRSPANITGPPILKSLAGRCFSYVDEHYEYRFCPFRNVTQHETKSHWSRFEGILGIWSGDWTIEANTFTGMRYDSGSLCSQKTNQLRRIVNVYLGCGSSNAIINVTEPEVCRYEMFFTTQLLCDPRVAKVYPTLRDTSKYQWDLLETLRLNHLITEKAYNFQLNQLFREAGLVQHFMGESFNSQVKFDNLEQCKRAYLSLLDSAKVAKASASGEN